VTPRGTYWVALISLICLSAVTGDTAPTGDRNALDQPRLIAVATQLRPGPARAPKGIGGFWVTPGPTDGVNAITILRLDSEWFVEVWGACQPTDCRWPRRLLSVLARARQPDAPDNATATWDGAISRSATFRRDGQDLVIEVTTSFHDDSGRPDHHITERLSRRTVPTMVEDLPKLPPLESAVRDAYQREFAETVPIPAIFKDQRSVDCAGTGHVTTTAYINGLGNRSTLLQMYLSHDGTQVEKKAVSSVITPAGTFKTLVVIVRYGVTVSAQGIKQFERAQEQINEDHAAFARSRGYAAPLIVFDNTNVVVEPDEISDPHKPADVRAAAARKGVSLAGYQFIIVIDPNPIRFAGGLATPPNGDVYVGNFGEWTMVLGQTEWTAIARTAYHHEVAHHWGWIHDWSPTCGETTLGFEPFLAAPALFGWEDVDGDGVPEILDDTPYGRTR
jgi:hypothetical protein